MDPPSEPCYSAFMFWEIYQQSRITKAHESAEAAKAKVEGQVHVIANLHRQIERLALTCQSLWELLRNDTNLTEENLEKKILEVDLRDGSADGKMGAQLILCPSCGRKSNSKRKTCVFCGGPIKPPHQFEG